VIELLGFVGLVAVLAGGSVWMGIIVGRRMGRWLERLDDEEAKPDG
jgi:hypothetical protein